MLVGSRVPPLCLRIFNSPCARSLLPLMQLIKRGAQIDVCDYLGKSPLFRACEASRLDLVQALLDLGVSPNPYDLRCAHFPLQTAIRRNDVEIVKVRFCLLLLSLYPFARAVRCLRELTLHCSEPTVGAFALRLNEALVRFSLFLLGY